MSLYYQFKMKKCITCLPVYYVKQATGGNDPSLTNAQKYSIIVKTKNR